jgi:aminopeptidase N
LDKAQIIEYYQKNPTPIVDLSIRDPLKVLSTNTYQKGGWVLNMLRHKLGDTIFWNGIRTYYKTYQNSNAMTKDFQTSMETVSGQDLESFFKQWIFTKGYPEIKWQWKYSNGIVRISIDQTQDQHVFTFPLEIAIKTGKETRKETLQITKSSQEFKIQSDLKPETIQLDPEVWLLFEAQEF